jgi:glycosyltransferase involved in cell wall biosynthesis
MPADELQLPGRRILMVVENLPVPFDRRVWQEAQALQRAGYDVEVICPKGRGQLESHEIVGGIRINRYNAGREATKAAAYIIEYSQALLGIAILMLKVARRGRIDVIHICNPPDLLFTVCLPFKLLFGTRIMFDHHDLGPELLMAKGYGNERRLVRLAYFLEKLTFRFADVSLATNDSYREVALKRGGMAEDRVFTVRSAPALDRFSPGSTSTRFHRGRDSLVAYVGVMGRQDGLSYLLDAARILVHERGRTDIQFTLAGSGSDLARLENECKGMDLEEYVWFLGTVSDDDLCDLLYSADVCVNPDEWNPLNNVSTMNKIMEYMAMSKPMVQFDMKEGKVSAGMASLYCEPNNSRALADGIEYLVDHPDIATRMGAFGRDRLERELAWEHQALRLLSAYERILSLPGRTRNARRENTKNLSTK